MEPFKIVSMVSPSDQETKIVGKKGINITQLAIRDIFTSRLDLQVKYEHSGSGKVSTMSFFKPSVCSRQSSSTSTVLIN